MSREMKYRYFCDICGCELTDGFNYNSFENGDNEISLCYLCGDNGMPSDICKECSEKINRAIAERVAQAKEETND